MYRTKADRSTQKRVRQEYQDRQEGLLRHRVPAEEGTEAARHVFLAGNQGHSVATAMNQIYSYQAQAETPGAKNGRWCPRSCDIVIATSSWQERGRKETTMQPHFYTSSPPFQGTTTPRNVLSSLIRGERVILCHRQTYIGKASPDSIYHAFAAHQEQ